MLLVHGNAGEAVWVVGLVSSIFAFDTDAILLHIHLVNASVFSRLDSQHLATTAVTNHVSHFILPSPLPIRASHLLTRIEYVQFVLVVMNITPLLHLAVDELVQISPGFVIRRYHKRSSWLL